MSDDLWERTDLTPFAARVRTFLLDQRPTMRVAELARRLRAADPSNRGVTPQSVWGWFHDGAVPHTHTLHLLSAVMDVSEAELRALTGQADRDAARLRAWAQRIQRDQRLSDVARERAVDWLLEQARERLARERVATDGVSGSDT